MRKRVVSAGHLCLDITPIFGQVDFLRDFRPGKLIGTGPAQIYAGGSVTNTGLALKYFGAEVSVMAKAGRDPFGSLLLDIFEKHNAADGIRLSEHCSTSYSVVIAPAGVDRIFLHHSGANDDFGYDDIDYHLVEKADLFHFGYPTLMKRLYQNPDELIAIFRKVKEPNVKTSLDLAAITEDAEAASVNWCAVLQELLPYVDYFVPSAEELCFLIDRPRYREWIERAGGGDITLILDWEKDVSPLADMLLNWGARTVLIKCGVPGLYLRTGEMQNPEWTHVQMFERSYKPDRFCSATGAGDVSIAAFLSAALEGYSPKRCLQLAAGAGACCVSSYDALSGLMPMEQMIARIDAGWEKL